MNHQDELMGPDTKHIILPQPHTGDPTAIAQVLQRRPVLLVETSIELSGFPVVLPEDGADETVVERRSHYIVYRILE